MKSRGFGFVIFEDEHTVQEVLNRYDDHHIFSKWVEPGFNLRSTASLLC